MAIRQTCRKTITDRNLKLNQRVNWKLQKINIRGNFLNFKTPLNLQYTVLGLGEFPICSKFKQAWIYPSYWEFHDSEHPASPKVFLFVWVIFRVTFSIIKSLEDLGEAEE